MIAEYLSAQNATLTLIAVMVYLILLIQVYAHARRLFVVVALFAFGGIAAVGSAVVINAVLGDATDPISMAAAGLAILLAGGAPFYWIAQAEQKAARNRAVHG